jgi:hypothetical protein
MVATGYLFRSDMEEDFIEVWVTIRLPKSLRQKFHAAAKVESMDASNTLRQFMNQTWREVYERNPKAFELALANIRAKEKDSKSSEGKPSKKAKKTNQSGDMPTNIKTVSANKLPPVNQERVSKKKSG